MPRCEEHQKRLGHEGGLCCSRTRFSTRTEGIARRAQAGKRRSGKVSENQTREALQTKYFISQPEISAEPGDFSEGKRQCSPPQRKNKMPGFVQSGRQRSLQ